MNKIILGDAIEVLKGYSDNTFDLTVTSPPYDNLRTYNGKIKDEVVLKMDLVSHLLRWLVNYIG